MSAASSSPDASRRPVGVNVAIWSVAIDTLPARMDRNRSPSGTRHIRWSHGLYRGVKWVSTSNPAGNWAVTPLCSKRFMNSGRRRLNR